MKDFNMSCRRCVRGVGNMKENESVVRNRVRPLARYTCHICGRKFWAGTKRAKYCSYECSREARKAYPVVPKVKDIPRESGEKSLERLVIEAAMCGLSYGQYRAALSMGKTFEEMRKC